VHKVSKIRLGAVQTLPRITFYEQTKLPVGGLISYEDLPADKNQ
jgi:hypothetical protein